VITATLSSVTYAFYTHADPAELAEDLAALLSKLGRKRVPTKRLALRAGERGDAWRSWRTPNVGVLAWLHKANHDCLALLMECRGEDDARWSSWFLEQHEGACGSAVHAYSTERVAYLDLSPFPVDVTQVEAEARRRLAAVVTGGDRLVVRASDDGIALAQADARTWVVIAPEVKGADAAKFLLTFERGLLLPSLWTANALRRGVAEVSDVLHRLDERRRDTRPVSWRRKASKALFELEPWLQRVRSDQAVAASLRRAPHGWREDLERLAREAEARVREVEAALAREGRTSTKREKDMTIQVFISHSAKNAGIAKALARCMENCVGVARKAIRCTSVPEYALQIGDKTDDVLRDEIEHCDIVIGLLSDESLDSEYVIMELGAAWGLKKTTCALLLPGVKYDQAPGPLKRLNHARADNVDHVTNLMRVVSRATGISIDDVTSFVAGVNDFVGAVNSAYPRPGP
jgi:hypothetical protein